MSNTSTWTNTWKNVTLGIYNLTAQAIGDWGTTTSAAVTVIVETPPTVSITSPAPGDEFPPQANIYIAANVKVNYDSTITRVDFYYNTTHGGRTLIGTVTTAPYSITWNNVPPGYYGISAQATDNNNLPGTSPNVDITVGTPPTVLITSPANGAVFLPSTNTNITANATASDGTVTQVVFYTNGVPIGTNTTAPYSIAWNNVQPGTYSLTAKATDNYGLATTSVPVSVRVDAPPTVSITSPTNGADIFCSQLTTSGTPPVTTCTNNSVGAYNSTSWGGGIGGGFRGPLFDKKVTIGLKGLWGTALAATAPPRLPT